MLYKVVCLKICAMTIMRFSIIHTEVRELSKGNCPEKFLAIFNLVFDFFSEKDSVFEENINQGFSK